MVAAAEAQRLNSNLQHSQNASPRPAISVSRISVNTHTTPVQSVEVPPSLRDKEVNMLLLLLLLLLHRAVVAMCLFASTSVPT